MPSRMLMICKTSTIRKNCKYPFEAKTTIPRFNLKVKSTKKRKVIFDDLDIPFEYDGIGPPVYYADQDIRRMFNLAGVHEGDIFYDLHSYSKLTPEYDL